MLLPILLSLIFSLPAPAASACTTEQVIGKGVVASRFLTVALGCVVQVTPREKPDLRYRDYWFDDRGRFLVFSSVPGDDPDKFTGTRSYFLFPRKRLPAFTLTASGDLTLQLGSGQDAVFGGVNARLASFPGDFLEDPAVSLENQGGLELRSFAGMRLDAGWVVGSQSYKNPQGTSTFYDAHNQSCAVRNDEFFFYENMYYGEPNLRFPTDASLRNFLGDRCPALDLSPLR